MSKNILLIQASPRGEGSLSRKITAQFISQLKTVRGSISVSERDLAKDPPPHVSSEVVASMFVPPDNRSREMDQILSLANELADELFAHDTIVISTPMFNRTVPSSLKAWIDHVVLPFKTFVPGPQGPTPLLKGKTVFFICATGGVYSHGSKMEEDFLTPYMKEILRFMGITDFRPIYVENTAFDQDGALKLATKFIEKALNDVTHG